MQGNEARFQPRADNRAEVIGESAGLTRDDEIEITATGREREAKGGGNLCFKCVAL